MGIFNFFKKSGKKVIPESTSVEPTAEQLAADRQAQIDQVISSVRMMNLDVHDLDIDLDGDQIIVNGRADSQEQREKVILALGNIQGISCVDDRITVPEPEPESTFYEVQSGDSLSKIAKNHYGDAMKYTVIFEANKPMLEDPNKIYPGQMLRIPKL